MNRPRVVIAGAGFGGLAAAKALARKEVDVIVLDRLNYHLFQPLLYQVATAALSPAQIAQPIRHILRRARNITVAMTEIVRIDPGARQVLTADGPCSYDYLIVATGTRPATFWQGSHNAPRPSFTISTGVPWRRSDAAPPWPTSGASVLTDCSHGWHGFSST